MVVTHHRFAVGCSSRPTPKRRPRRESIHGHAGRPVDGVIGVDTHRDTRTAAAVTAVGGLLGQLVVTADAAGISACLALPAVMFRAVDASPSKTRAATAPG
jgi:hypothetical protein